MFNMIYKTWDDVFPSFKWRVRKIAATDVHCVTMTRRQSLSQHWSFLLVNILEIYCDILYSAVQMQSFWMVKLIVHLKQVTSHAIWPMIKPLSTVHFLGSGSFQCTPSIVECWPLLQHLFRCAVPGFKCNVMQDGHWGEIQPKQTMALMALPASPKLSQW